MQFPKDFLWGTATSSYQIEGAANEDGKGKSIWDVFTHVPGTVKDRSNGDVAIDHYHRFREDIRLMAKMGIRNYRFSISWGRILPDGTGAVNEKGLAFYSELVDCLLENGIRPFCTLYHWDLPYALHLRGGWLSPDMPEWFANYTTIVADALGDRVKDFITINEPQCIIGSGYALGVHAPGLKCCAADIVRAAHHLMLAHGRAVQVLRAHVPGVRVGYAPCGDPCVPYTNSPEDIAAARKEYFTVHIDEKVGSAWNIAWFSDPVMLGQYPADIIAANYDYYEPRTEHGSSLSACMYALCACAIGRPAAAYPLFLKSAEADIVGGGKQWAGLVYIGGTHPAAAGGAYMVLLYGFLGLRFEDGKPTLHPRLPEGWKKVQMQVHWQGKDWLLTAEEGQQA